MIFLNQHISGAFEEDMKDEKNHPRLFTRVHLYSKFFYVQTISVFMTVIMYAIIPIVALAKHGKYLRMMPCIYPITYKPGGFGHWMLYCMEVIGGTYLSSVTSAVDNSFGMYALHMCAGLRVLATKFEKLANGEDYKKNVRDCIRRHQTIIAAKKRLENLYGFIAIWLAVTAAIVLCTLIFQFTEAVKTKTVSLNLGLLILYIVLKFIQAFSFATYGNDIYNESRLCLGAIYNARWPDAFDAKFRNDALIVLVQKPIVLVAKGCMNIQLDMFAKIVNTSVSYFFLLQTLNEE